MSICVPNDDCYWEPVDGQFYVNCAQYKDERGVWRELCDYGGPVCPDCPGGPAERGFIGLDGHIGQPWARRWVRPREVGTENGRNAWGWLASLDTFELLKDDEAPAHPVRIGLQPIFTIYDMAAVWMNDGFECFGMDQCSAHCGHDRLLCDFKPDSPRCSPGPGGVPIFRGSMVSCSAKGGVGWEGIGHDITCLECASNLSVPVSPASVNPLRNNMEQAAWLSLSACSSNRLVGCRGRIPGDPLRCNEEGDENPFYDDHDMHGLWRECRVKFNDMRIEAGDAFNLTPADRHRLAVKNAALALIAADSRGPGGIVDLRHMLTDFNSNSSLDYWVSRWSLNGQCEHAPVIYRLPRSYMAAAKCRLDVEVVILSASAELSLALMHLRQAADGGDPDIYKEDAWPLVRLKVSVELGVRCTFPDGPCHLVRPWMPEPERDVELGFADGDDCQRRRVQPGGLDHPVFVAEDGVSVIVPQRFTWLGGRSAYTAPPTINISPHGQTTERWRSCNKRGGPYFGPVCCNLAAQLSTAEPGGYRVPGMPWSWEPRQVLTPQSHMPKLRPLAWSFAGTPQIQFPLVGAYCNGPGRPRCSDGIDP